MLAAFGWTPRDADELSIGELMDAWGMVPVLRRERLREQAVAARAAKAADKGWNEFMKGLE